MKRIVPPVVVKSSTALQRAHSPSAISARLREPRPAQYLSDAVLGGIDGCVTTFAVVSGAVGAGFSTTVALVLGASNLVADGFSMAVSNYEAVNADREHAQQLRLIEEHHIDQVPEGEREEVRQLFERKGFSGSVLKTIVDTITSNRSLWVETMLLEEHGIALHSSRPLRSAMTTFGAFVLVGSVPLIPFLYRDVGMDTGYFVSAALAAVMFFLVGGIKSWHLDKSVFFGGTKTLLSGGAAASLAFLIGYALRNAMGIG